MSTVFLMNTRSGKTKIIGMVGRSIAVITATPSLAKIREQAQ